MVHLRAWLFPILPLCLFKLSTHIAVHSTSAHTHTYAHTHIALFIQQVYTHIHTHMLQTILTSIYCAWHWEVLWESPGKIKHDAHP